MMFERVLLCIVAFLLAYEYLCKPFIYLKRLGAQIMASVQELADAVVAASVSVKALADAYAAKPAGIDPASLDPVLEAANNLKSVADAALNPPAPGA